MAFEKLCLKHIEPIRVKLGISGVLTNAFSWRGEAGGSGAQIDLIIDRMDGIVNLCEIKYAPGPFEIDKKTSVALREKKSTFIASTRIRKAAQTTMITTFGLKPNAYSAEITAQIVLDDLFW